MRVVGTAGHVDHGKSTLVAALTGIHPDRLKEEQDREMTIDLGFAWMALPDGETIGIVDVPGHRDFIENMLAGVGGIDAVLFVIAADEGVMPQTREHLAILDLLQIAGGVVVLTKVDLIDDPDWLDLVEADVAEAMHGTVLGDAPLVRVSARTGQGLDDLLAALVQVLSGRPPRADLGRPRLPIDRVFTMPGFGTVVTGTLTDGRLRVGEDVELYPSGVKGRVRGLQTHKTKEDTAVPGSRTAVNISGIDLEQVRRGDVLAHPGRYRPSQRLDVYFRLLPDAAGPLKHSAEVKFFVGAAEVLARVRLLGVEELRPGEEGWLQLELHEPVLAVRGDRYILRRPSPGETLGGGAVVDPQPARRHKRFAPEVLAQLESLRQGTPADVLAQAVAALGLAPLREAASRSRLSVEQLGPALIDLIDSGELVPLEPGPIAPDSDALAVVRARWAAETARAQAEVEQYHKSYPLRRGIPREELKSRLKYTPRVFNAALKRWLSEGQLLENGHTLRLPDHSVRFTPAQQKTIDLVLARFTADPFNPPSVKETQAGMGDEVYAALVEQDWLVQVSPDVVYRRADYDALLAAVRAHFTAQATLTVAEFRDLTHSSRKYVLAFLEHLDSIGVTARDGDVRRLRQK